MLVTPFVLPISGLNPDFILTNIDQKGLEVVAFVIETSSSFQIEAPAVPIASEDSLPDHPSGQWIAHMGALVVSGVDPSIYVKQRDATPISQPDSFRFTGWNTAERPDVYPL
jgi:hypothetical protein